MFRSFWSRWKKSITNPSRLRGSERGFHLKKPARFRPEIELLENRLAPATCTWTGLGDHIHWSDGANWDTAIQQGDTLVFGSAGITAGAVTPTNDTALGSFFSVQITAAGYTLTGNPIDLVNSLTASFDTGTSTYSIATSGTAGVTKSGTGSLILSTANAWTGSNTIQVGTLTLTNGAALGPGSGDTTIYEPSSTTVEDGASLVIDGHINVTTGDLYPSGTGVGGQGALQAMGMASTENALFTGTIHLNDSSSVGVATGCILGVKGMITVKQPAVEPFKDLSKVGDGALVLESPCYYSGDTHILAGELVTDVDNALPAPPNNGLIPRYTNVTVAENASLELFGTQQIVSTITGPGGIINDAGLPATLTVTNQEGSSTLDCGIGMDVDLVFNAPNTLTLSNGGNRLGVVTIQLGTLQQGAEGVLTGAAVYLGGTTTSLDLNGYSTTLMKITSTGGSIVSATPATLTIDPGDNPEVSDLEGPVTGPITLVKSGGQSLILGSNGNTYNGGTTINAGILQVTGAGVLPGSVLDNGTLIFTRSDDLTYSGVISGTGTLQQSGTGTLTLTGSSNFTGMTTVAAGTLLVGGTIASVQALNGTFLGGNGTTGAITSQGGTIRPGTASTTSILDSGNLSLDAASTFTARLNGTTPGIGYDQLDVNGSVNLGNALLNVSLGYKPAVGDIYTLIANDGTDSVVGTFAGLPEGSLITIGSSKFRISYAGGDGNDVTLQFVQDTASVLLSSSFGNAVLGQSVTFSATVTASSGTPTGLVTFSDGTNSIGQGTLNPQGVASLTTSSLAAGSHSISATYNGDSNFLTSTSSSLTLTVGKVNQQFVQGLYQSLLGRPADPSGLAA